MKILFILFFLTIQLMAVAQTNNDNMMTVVKTSNGILQGTDESGIVSFKGIPFAAPPVGELRWKEPQPVKNWDRVRKADKFGPRAMQRPIFGDMGFRSDGMSEDCLYLNVWTPARTGDDRLSVLVYFYGGGLVAGDGSEARYDGENMARKGIVAMTVNYRLNLFGFLAHPELTKESPHHSSSNYGYMDQAAALRWIQQNITAFGGDPKKVTIAGESAGSISVSAMMVSPLSKELIAGAIGSSGSILGTLSALTLAEGEQKGLKFAEMARAKSLADLRKIPAEQLIEIAKNHEFELFSATIDGYFFPKAPVEIFAAGQQSHVPLLAGWNSAEMNYQAVMFGKELTIDNYKSSLKALYGDKADAVFNLYQASTPEEIAQAATDLASDRFTAFSTWKWSDLQNKTGGQPVYRYIFSRPRPAMRSEMGNKTAGLAGGVMDAKDSNTLKLPVVNGAVHSAEIEYAMGNLPTNRVYDWQPEDFKVSEIFREYYANFVKTGNPNGAGVPIWTAVKADGPIQIMIIDADTRQVPETHRDRYLFLDKLNLKK